MKNVAKPGISPETNETTLTNASKEAVMHHLSSFVDNDLESVLSDYTDESVLITQGGTYTGLRQIRSFFTPLMAHFPKQFTSFTLDKFVAEEDFVYIVWHAKTPTLDVQLGSDTFVLKNNKIYQQTYVSRLTELHPVDC